MKFSIVGPVYPFRGGIAHYTTMLSQALARHHQVQVISFRRQYPARLYPGQTDKDPSRQPILVSADYLLDPLYPWSWAVAGKRILAFQPDLVLIQWWTTFWAPADASLAFALRRRGVKIVFNIHNVQPHEARPWDTLLARLALSQGHKFLVLSDNEKTRLLRLMPEAQAVFTPLPVYDMFTASRLPKDEARRRLGLPAEAAVILFFGIVRPYKGLSVLVEALGRLRDQGVNTFLLAAGEFWEKKEPYLERISELNLPGQVRLEDRYIPNEELGLFFSAADVFAAPYIAGTQSAAVKMALGFGLPVVMTTAIAGPEFQQPGLAVQIVPPGDAAALAEGLRRGLAAGDADQHPYFPASGWQDTVAVIEGL